MLFQFFLQETRLSKCDGFVKSRRIRYSVIPAQAGIQFFEWL